MDKVRIDFQTLYQREEPHLTGLLLATHVDLVKVNEYIPLEAEVEASVCQLRLHMAGGHTHLRAEHFKQWRREAYPGEKLKTPFTNGSLDVSGRHCTGNVAHGGDPTGVAMNCPSPNSKNY